MCVLCVQTIQTQVFLKDTWVPMLRSSIHQCLMDVRKGWFSLDETNFEVYQGSKLKKFMELTKFAMQVYTACVVSFVKGQGQLIMYGRSNRLWKVMGEMHGERLHISWMKRSNC